MRSPPRHRSARRCLDLAHVGYRHLVEPHGLRACWSFPIIGSDGHVLGTFAVYYRESRAPEPAAVDLIKRAAHVAGIAIERRQLDDQLRALSDRIEAVREEERANIAREIRRREPRGTVVALSVPLRFPAERDEDRELGA